MTKVQLTLTDQEAAILTGYGDQLGYNLTKVAKFFVSKATERLLNQGVIPVYKMSEETEKRGLEAIKEDRQGKTIEIKDVDEFFDRL